MATQNFRIENNSALWLVKVTDTIYAQKNGKFEKKESLLDAQRTRESDIGAAVGRLAEKHRKAAKNINHHVEIHTYNLNGIRVGWYLVQSV